MPRRKPGQPKRRHSFGTIVQSKGSNRFQARYTRDGKCYYLPGTFATKAQGRAALRLEERYLEDLRSPADFVPPKQRQRDALAKQERDALTVGAWMQQWLTIIEADLKPSTVESYTRAVGSSIFNATGKMAELKDIPLTKLTRADVIAWVDELKHRWKTGRTAKGMYSRLHTALEEAVRRELIPANPCDGIRNTWPAPKRKELPETEVIADIHAHMQERYKIVSALTFFHGLRIGEVLGLRRRDIEQTRQGWVVHIRGNAYRKKGGGMVRMDTPKTEASYRDVPVFPQFVPLIEHHLATYVDAHPDAPVCPTEKGAVVMDTSYRSILERVKAAAGHSQVELTPHYGRVWVITALVEAGMTIPAIGEILGQRDLSTITETYMRTSEAKKRETLARVDEALGKVL